MHILFAGGGTAGHINPALAVAQYVAKKHPEAKISYIGKKGGMEERLVAASGFDFYGIDVAGFQRKLTVKNIFRNISAAEKALTSSSRSKKLLKKLAPDVVVGTGGYVSGPVLRQAAKLGIKTAIHEQNAYPGVTTKMLVPLVDTVMLAMSEAKTRLKLKKSPVITGNPVREEFLTLSKQTSRRELNLPADLVDKVPIDGLCGKTDEENIGFSYAMLDVYIREGICEDEAIKEKIDRMHKNNLFKLELMPCFEI